MTTQTAAPVITAIEVRPEDGARYQKLVAELRDIASRGIDPVWTFVRTGPVQVTIGGAVLLETSLGLK